MEGDTFATLAARIKALRLFAATTFYRAGLPEGQISDTPDISL